jgi:hypothetical protein
MLSSVNYIDVAHEKGGGSHWYDLLACAWAERHGPARARAMLDCLHSDYEMDTDLMHCGHSWCIDSHEGDVQAHLVVNQFDRDHDWTGWRC